MIKLTMLKRGLSHADVASKANISVTTLYKVIADEKVRESTLYRIKKAVGLIDEPSELTRRAAAG